MLGLGDRHLDNILFEPRSGRIIHIDFECLFNKGKELGVPEIVDFRLTKNLRYGMGYLLEQGLFRELVIEILKLFVKNQEAIIDFLDPFIYDPLLCRTSVKDIVEFFNKRLQLKNVEDEVDRLIKRNLSSDVLKMMYHGWAPFL